MARPYYLPPDRVTIISVVPSRLYIPLLHGVYVADAAPKVKGQTNADGKRYTCIHLQSEPEATSIPARVQWVDTKISDDIPANMPIADMAPMPIPAEAIAQDLLRKLSTDAVNADDFGRPGILILADGQTEPTEEQLNELIELQDAYAARVVMEGREHEAKGEYNEISATYHVMWAKWLGLGDDPFHKRAMLGQSSGDGNVAALLGTLLSQKSEIEELKAMVQQITAARGVAPPLSPTSPKAAK